MKKAFLYRPVTLDMVSGNVYWFVCPNHASPIYSWCLGGWIYDFRCFPYRNGVVERRIS